MVIPGSWSGEAFNPVPESENRIHGDDVARAYGFRGGLVPGVVVSAYLLHPAAVAWGRQWLERGRAHAVVRSPVYDGERFQVDVQNASETAYEARLIDPRGECCASAEVELPASLPAPPVRRGDPELDRGAPRPLASRETLERLRATGLLALRGRWGERAEITSYLSDPNGMAPIHRDQRLANPAFLLGLTNWVLGRNLKLDAWLHLETWSQHYRAVAPGDELVVEASVADLFEKKGHQFVDLEVAIFGQPGDEPVACARLRAIYALRAPGRPATHAV